MFHFHTELKVFLLSALVALLFASCPNPLEEGVLEQLQDLEPPIITVIGPPDGSAFESTVTVSGTILDADASGSPRTGIVSEYIAAAGYDILDADSTFTEMIIGEDGSFSFTLPTAEYDSSIKIILEATDLNGNRSQKTLDLVPDTLGPSLDITSPEDFSIYSLEVILEGRVSNADNDTGISEVSPTVSYQLPGTIISGTMDIDPTDGSFSTIIDTSAISGSLRIDVTATDLNGNSTTLSRVLESDSEGPSLTVTSPEDFSEYATVLELAGSVSGEDVEDTVSYRIVGTTISGDLDVDPGNGGFSAVLDVSSLSGSKVLEIIAADEKGNETTRTINITKPEEGGDISGFTVTPGNKQVALSWDPVPLAESYTVTEWTYGNELSGITGTSYTWEGLENGEEYIFSVTAVLPESVGADAESSLAEVIPLGVRSLTPWITEIGYGSVSLAWQDYSMIDRYLVERSTSVDGPWETRRSLTDNHFTDYGLTGGSTYFYRVSPSNNSDVSSEPIAVASSTYLSDSPEVTMSGEVHASIINGSCVYSVCDNGAENILDVTDISFPSSPNKVRSIYLDGSASNHPTNDLVIDGSHLYVTQGDAGIAVFNIANPQKPTLVNTFDTAGDDTFALWVDGSELYVAAGSYGLRVLSLADPANLSEIGYLSSIPEAMDVVVDDGFAYVSSVDQLFKIDVSDPDAPSRVSNGPGGAPCCDGIGSPRLQAHNGFVFMSGYFDGWGVDTGGRVWSFPAGTLEPPSPEPVNGEALDMVADMPIYDDTGYLLHGNGIQMFDVSNPESPQDSGPVGGVSAAVSDLDVTGSLQVISTYDPHGMGTGGSLIIQDTDTPNGAVLSQYIDFGGDVASVSAIDVEGDYAYLLTEHDVDSTGRLAIVDISDPENPGNPVFTAEGFPRTVQSFDGYVRDISVQGDFAYIADPEADFIVVDVSDPLAPGDPVYLNVSGEIHALNLSGEYAYVAGTKLSVIDISDPASSVLLTTVDITESLRIYDMTRYENKLYLSGEEDLISFDISDPESPESETSVQFFTGIDSYSAAVDGNYLYYLYEATNDFHVINAATYDPTNDLTYSDINLASHTPFDIAVSGDYAVVATYQDNTTDLSELVVVDISEFRGEAVVGTPIELSGKALSGIDLRGSWVFGSYSDDDFAGGGLVIFNLNGE